MPVCSETGPRAGHLRLVSQPPRDIVVIQLARLGDLLQTTPLLAALRGQHPRARLALALPPGLAPLARACRFVDHILPLDPATLAEAAACPDPGLARARLLGLCAPLWQHPAQEVYNLNLNQATACLAAGWAGARLRGWRCQPEVPNLAGEPWSAFMMLLVGDRRLTRLHLCDVLASYAQPLGPPLSRLEYRPTPEALAAGRALLPQQGPRVILQLGASNQLRRWPLESFAELARGLGRQGAQLILVGSQAERPLGRCLARALGPGGPPLHDLMGQTGLEELAGVLAGADLVISNDTGPLHLATALGTPVLALFMGPARVHETGPYGQGHLVLQARGDCGPCAEGAPSCAGAAPCRGLLGAQPVLRAALRLLEGAPAEQAGQDLDLPPGVEALASRLDYFGQRYQPLERRPLDLAQALSLALRQASRQVLRPGLASPSPDLAAELAAEYLPTRPEELPQLEGLAQAARRLAGLAAAGQEEAARRLLLMAPGLKPLGLLVGPQAPPGLAPACDSAARVLERSLGW